jgi:ABC-type multidrug transport system fused ATPase/permease subunit
VLGSLEAKLTIESNQEIYEVLSSFRESFVKNRRSYYARVIGAKRLKLANVDASFTFLNISNKYALDSAILVGAILVATIQFISVGGVQAISSLGLFLAASSRIAPAVLRLQQNAVEIRNNLSSSEMTFKLMESFQPAEEVQLALDEFDDNYQGFEGSISVQNASFQYPNSKDFALQNIDLEFHNAKYYAIVGSSGSGKSTLVDLILGVLEPVSGQVKISGKPPRDAIQEWQGAIAYVPQDIAITEGTIRDNVRLGFPKVMATDERVLKAIKTAQLLDFVGSLPEGIDTYVGDRGTKLSGGQRQRLGIARAFFTNPKLIVLDEATSSLDAQVEAEFTAAIGSLKGNVTVVVIAHRLSTVRDADSIVFLDRGKIQAMGRFDEVRRQVKNFDTQAGLMGL